MSRYRNTELHKFDLTDQTFWIAQRDKVCCEGCSSGYSVGVRCLNANILVVQLSSSAIVVIRRQSSADSHQAKVIRWQSSGDSHQATVIRRKSSGDSHQATVIRRQSCDDSHQMTTIKHYLSLWDKKAFQSCSNISIYVYFENMYMCRIWFSNQNYYSNKTCIVETDHQICDWQMAILLPFLAKVQTVILKCWRVLNLNWFKSYDTKRKCFQFHFFAIL